MPFKFIETPLKGAWLIEPLVRRDHRGFFVESYHQREFAAKGLEISFVQDNHACSLEVGVLRGLHFQKAPYAQTKLVRVTRGRIFDAIVDLREGSPTFGQSYAVELNAENFLMLWVPQGFAHGYCTLESQTEVLYKVDAFYAPAYEGGVRWNDPALQIAWPVAEPILSEKDARLPTLAEWLTSP